MSHEKGVVALGATVVGILIGGLVVQALTHRPLTATPTAADVPILRCYLDPASAAESCNIIVTTATMGTAKSCSLDMKYLTWARVHTPMVAPRSFTITLTNGIAFHGANPIIFYDDPANTAASTAPWTVQISKVNYANDTATLTLPTNKPEYLGYFNITVDTGGSTCTFDPVIGNDGN